MVSCCLAVIFNLLYMLGIAIIIIIIITITTTMIYGLKWCKQVLLLIRNYCSSTDSCVLSWRCYRLSGGSDNSCGTGSNQVSLCYCAFLPGWFKTTGIFPLTTTQYAVSVYLMSQIKSMHAIVLSVVFY